MITGKTPYISTVSLLNRPINTATAGASSALSGAETNVSPIRKIDTTHLSDAGVSFIADTSDNVDPARSEKVQAIKQAIEEKRYHIESRKIAEKLLQEASELLGTLTGYPEDPSSDDRTATNSLASSSSNTSNKDAEDPVYHIQEHSRSTLSFKA